MSENLNTIEGSALEKEVAQDAALEYFSDSFNFSWNPWACTVIFSLTTIDEGEPERRSIRVRMPLGCAKAMAISLAATISMFEKSEQFRVELPSALLDALEISKLDWDKFDGD